jgi:small subunit ribosomal protein S14
MSKTSVVARNEKRRRLIAKFSEQREYLKSIGDYESLQNLPRNSAPTRLRSRCNLTGKGKGVYRKFGLCRNVFRQMALEGKIPGVRKASW